VSRPIRVLAVDDQPENLELLGAILEEDGYDVAFAADGVAALAAIERDPPDAVLLDLMMPRLDGIEVCRRLKRARASCFVPVILLTALSDVESKVRGLESGADDFLNKPFNRIELLTRLRSLLRIRGLRDELDSTESVIFSMVELLEGKHPRTRHHSLRVAALAGAAARRGGLPPHAVQELVWGGLLHDLGKLGVPEAALLRSAAERTPEEERRYREHPQLGMRILAPIESLAGVVRLVGLHHERLDGSGYPAAIAGERFDRSAELLALANLVDHLRIAAPGSPELWRRELSREAAAGRFHSAAVADVFAALAEVADDPKLADVLPVPLPPPGGRVLVVDDSATNRQLYRELLETAGLEPLVAASGVEALELWRSGHPDLLLVDVRLPGISGAEVCRRVKRDPESSWLPVVLVTAYEARETRREAIEAGADDLLLAPVNRTELLARVRSLLRLRVFHQDLVAHESVVLSLSAALEAKDAYTRGHSLRVGELSARLARELGDGERAERELRLGGLLHDIGKIAVPEPLLHKAGRLTPEEFQVVMMHPVVGWEICRRLRSAQPALDAIRYHHERFDGRGYPEGLAGEAIPRQARILAVADALDALTSERPYRSRLPLGDAVELLATEMRRGKWDPDVFGALVRLHARAETDLRRQDTPPPLSRADIASLDLAP